MQPRKAHHPIPAAVLAWLGRFLVKLPERALQYIECWPIIIIALALAIAFLAQRANLFVN